MPKSIPLPPPSKSQAEAARSGLSFDHNESRERQGEMKSAIEYEQEEDGRWLAKVKELPRVLVYGKDLDAAAAPAQALALRVIEYRLESRESAPSLMHTFSMTWVTGKPSKPNACWPSCCGLAGRSNATRDHTKFWNAPAGPMLLLRCPITRKSTEGVRKGCRASRVESGRLAGNSRKLLRSFLLYT